MLHRHGPASNQTLSPAWELQDAYGSGVGRREQEKAGKWGAASGDRSGRAGMWGCHMEEALRPGESPRAMFFELRENPGMWFSCSYEPV